MKKYYMMQARASTQLFVYTKSCRVMTRMRAASNLVPSQQSRPRNEIKGLERVHNCHDSDDDDDDDKTASARNRDLVNCSRGSI